MSRDDLKRRVVTAIQQRFVSPVMSRVGSWMRGSAVLETIGRRTGLPRQTPVGGRLIDGTFWLVAEHGREADYVRNLEKNSRVRILVDGEWRKGTASVERSTDPRRLLRRLPWHNSLMVRLVGTDLLAIRIELDG